MELIMKNKELMKLLQDLDPELEIVTRIDKHYTHRKITKVEEVLFDSEIGEISYLECFDDDIKGNAIAIND